MSKNYRLLLAIGNIEIEEKINVLPDVTVIDSDSDIEIITDILDYEMVDFVIVNTVLSEEKSVMLAKKAKEKSVKVIALVESQKNKEWIATLVGFGVKAFVQLDEIQKIGDYVRNYPEAFNFGVLQEKKDETKGRSAGIRGKLFGTCDVGRIQKAAPGCRIIGVVGVSSGSGASSLCIGYALHLMEKGQRVLILDRTENKHLSRIVIKGQAIDSHLLNEVNLAKYDCVIIDFGKLAEMDGNGNLNPGFDMTNEKRLERQFCNEIILVGSSLPWRLFEMTAYIENPAFEKLTEGWIFYINGQKNSAFESAKTAYENHRTVFVHYEHEDPYDQFDSLLERRGYDA